MKILLFWPGAGGGALPLSIPLLQSIIKASGHEACIFDSTAYHPSPRSTRGMLYKKSGGKDVVLNKEKYAQDFARGAEAFTSVVNEYQPDVIAMSVFSTNFLIGRAYYAALKNAEKIFFLVGGVHPTLCPDETIGCPEVDAICVGEGEEAIAEFLKCCAGGALSARDFRGIDNLWYKDKNGRTVKNKIGRVANIDNLPLPDLSGSAGPQKFTFVGKEYKIIHFQLSRGCPLHCSYCCNDAYKKAIFSGTRPVIRRISPEKAIGQMRIMRESYGVGMFRFIDENFLAAPMEWLTDFCDTYQRHIGLPFTISGSAGLVMEEKVKLIKKSGCVNVNIGPESGNEEYRKNVLKKTEPDLVYLRARGLFAEYGIRVNANFLFGLPLQTENVIRDTIRFMRRLNCPVSTEIYIPLPGSELYEMVAGTGYQGFKTDYDCYRSLGEPVYIPEGTTRKRILELSRTMVLYARLSPVLWPMIKFCESENKEANRLLDVIDAIFTV